MKQKERRNQIPMEGPLQTGEGSQETSTYINSDD